jgi:hypothetical protein
LSPTRRFVCALVALGALAALTGCTSSRITQADAPQGGAIARPDRIIVHDFSADPRDLPADSALAGQVAEPAVPPTSEEQEVGRRLGASVATELVSEIQAMGLNAARAEGQPPPRVGDGVLRGYFLTIDEGSTLKRVVVGFGAGSAQLQTMVEGFLMTEDGLRRMGSAEVSAGGGKLPGTAMPLAVTLATANPIGLAVGGAVKVATEVSGVDKIDAVGKSTAKEIAKELRVRFEQRGWID